MKTFIWWSAVLWFLTGCAAPSPSVSDLRYLVPSHEVAEHVMPSGASGPKSLAPRFGHVVNVRQFGAKADGVTDDGTAIQAALDTVAEHGGVVYLPAGTYLLGSIVRSPVPGYLNNTFLELRTNVSLAGAGSATIIRVKNGVQNLVDDTLTGHVFQGAGVSNITIRDLVIDMNGPNNLTPSGHIRNGHAIRFLNGGAGVRIENVTVLNNPGHNDIAANGSGHNLIITGCHLRNGGHYVTGAENVHNIDFSFVYSEWSSTLVERNTIEQEEPDVALRGYTGGIELHGGRSRALSNALKGCDPAVWIASAPAPVSDIIVADNTMERCARGVAFWNAQPMRNVVVRGNRISLYLVARSPTPVAVGVQQPNGSATKFDGASANGAFVENLEIVENTITCSLPNDSRLLARGIEIHSIQNGRVAGNHIEGMTEMGVILLGSPWGMTNLTLEQNEIVNCGRAPGVPLRRRAAVFVSFAGSSRDPDLPFFAKNLRIQHNTFGNRPVTGTNAAQGKVDEPTGSQQTGVSIARMTFPAKVDGFYVDDNRFESLPYPVYDGRNTHGRPEVQDAP